MVYRILNLFLFEMFNLEDNLNLKSKYQDECSWFYHIPKNNDKCWKETTIPQIWRTSIIRPLLKEGKNQAVTESNRSISLKSCIGKIQEKIIADILMYHL